MSAHDYTFTALDGSRLPMQRFTGHPVLLVNTASECGYTRQYAGLQALHERYAGRGLVVLGVPCNDFGAQEPGDEAAIGAFCEQRYGIGFPLTAKVHVIGADAHPLYRWLGATLGEDALPRWNFHKYLLDGGGEPVGMWPSRVEPDDPALVAAIEGALPEGR